jgi:hypothetical protein
MKNLLNTFLYQKTHRKPLHFLVKLEYIINSLTQLMAVLSQLDLVLQKIFKHDNENQIFIIWIYLTNKQNNYSYTTSCMTLKKC